MTAYVVVEIVSCVWFTDRLTVCFDYLFRVILHCNSFDGSKRTPLCNGEMNLVKQ
jgi:hypothetical protein